MSSKKSVTVNKKTDIGELVKKAQLGDTEAFGNLYELYADDMYRFALWYIGNTVLAEDAVSDAVCSAFENIRSVKKRESFKSWLFRILSNICKKYLSEKINERNGQPIDEDIADTADFLEKTELWSAVQELKETERQVLLLKVLGGCKSDVIGEMLSMKPSTVRSVLSRTLEKLRKMLD